MEKSVINIYLWPTSDELSIKEQWPSKNLLAEPYIDWLQEPFGRECLASVDKSTYLGDYIIHNEVLGNIAVERISGGAATLLMAYHYKELRFPLANLGDNCAECLFESGVGKPSQWYWEGYCPKLLPDQVIVFPELGRTITGSEAPLFFVDELPEELTITGRYSKFHEG